ncbi:MAG: hypothetical protein EOO51_08885 [Flavobacterium sp.]|nr:MAG: hypothetical protein EOO51_08885 [Flavobacterium sp.]
MATKIIRLVIAAAVATCSGCSGAFVTGAWKTTDINSYNPKKILVLATVEPGNDSLRNVLEQKVERRLHYLSYKAASSGMTYGSRAFDLENESAMTARMATDSVDAVITITLLNWKIERKAMPEDLWCSPYNNYNRMFWCYQGAITKRVGSPSYFSPQASYFWEVNLYDASTQKLLYCVRTGHTSLPLVKKNAMYCIDLIISDMVWQDVLQTP